MDKQICVIEGRKATLYKSQRVGLPLIVLNHYCDDGTAIMAELLVQGSTECNLLVVNQLRWEHDMTPWTCLPLGRHEPPCSGGADEYLKLLNTHILPWAKERLVGKPAFIGIAGYSLAGLFALYAMYKCDVFTRAASMSGSLWFPEFKDFVTTHELCKRPDKIYISLGDREAYTKNVYLKTVQTNTEEIVAHYRKLGLDITWELNSGNHFKDTEIRSAKGIKALLYQ